jgi:hypothetical protein
LPDDVHFDRQRAADGGNRWRGGDQNPGDKPKYNQRRKSRITRLREHDATRGHHGNLAKPCFERQCDRDGGDDGGNHQRRGFAEKLSLHRTPRRSETQPGRELAGAFA